MSGILALLHRGVAARDASETSGPFSRPDLLERLTGLMSYRAPDGSGTWHRGPVGLGHALLRTHTRGEQTEPGVIHDPAAGLSIVADARLDGREELVRALRAAGVAESHVLEAAVDGSREGAVARPLHPASPAPDLLLAAYRAWGAACPEHLLGDFAFVIWDGSHRTLFAARDPFGVKPLFVAEVGGDEGWVALSNTLPALLEHPGVSREPDERSLADYLFWGGIYDERRTGFADVRQVERGSWLEVGPNGLREERYWALPHASASSARSRRDTLDEFRHLLGEAVRDRLPEPPHPAVLQLSGGLDSGTIACAAVDVRGGPEGLPAVTMGYGRLFDDPEPPLARQVAAALGLEHVVLLADDWTEPLPGMAVALPDWATHCAPPLEPGYDLADVGHPPISGRGRVTLTGWDGDALLQGDARGNLARLARSGRLIGLARDLAVLAREGVLHRRPPRTGLRGALRRRLSAAPDPMDGYPEGLLDPDFEARCDLREVWRSASLATPSDTAPGDDPRAAARRILESPVWSGLFQAQDPGFTGHAVEARHPLMDLRVVRFLLGLPVVPWCVEKGLLRAYLRPRLPTGIWRRKKQGLQGDPLVLTLKGAISTAQGRADLAARLARDPQDSLVARRLLLSEWHTAFQQALEADDGEGMWPYWGTRAHAVGRWLQSLEGREPPRSGNGSSGHEGRQDNDNAEAVPPA